MVLKVNGRTLITKVKIADNGLERLKGLMFEDRKKFDYGLVMVMRRESRLSSSIHMMFVFFPIDVLFLDKKKVVVDKTTLNPFHPNYTPKKAAKYIIELPLKKSNQIFIGDKVSW